jgi:hypothetical protein
MPTPDGLRAGIASARQDFQSALEGAGASWETKPASGAEGEESWTPRQVAEHAIGADVYFASEICSACGYPGLELSRLSLPTPADALTAFAEASAKSDGRLKYVSENDLTMKHEKLGLVSDIMAMSVSHLRDHAAQIRAVS